MQIAMTDPSYKPEAAGVVDDHTDTTLVRPPFLAG